MRKILSRRNSRVLELLTLTFLSRAISVILGDKWKKMKSEDRRMYTMEAKALAEEQKRLNPDCWKRKRTNSVSLLNNIYPVFRFSHVSNITIIPSLNRVPSRLRSSPRIPSCCCLACRRAGQSLTDCLTPLRSPVFLRLNCDDEFTCFYNLETL